MTATVSGEQAYWIYKSIKTHFGGSFDLRKYSGLPYKPEEFEGRSDRSFFFVLANKYETERKLKILFASNFVYNPSLWIGDFLDSDTIENNYYSMFKVLESLSTVVSSDLELVLDRHGSLKSALKFDGVVPPIITMTMSHKIRPESLVIFDRFMGIFDYISNEDEMDLNWPIYRQRFEKFSPFVSIKSAEIEQKIRKSFKNLLTNAANTSNI